MRDGFKIRHRFGKHGHVVTGGCVIVDLETEEKTFVFDPKLFRKEHIMNCDICHAEMPGPGGIHVCSTVMLKKEIARLKEDKRSEIIEEMAKIRVEVDGELLVLADYMKKMLRKVFIEEECFNGKRPFGNSGWKHDIYSPMVDMQIIWGMFDEDHYLEDFDQESADEYILEFIDSLFSK